MVEFIKNFSKIKASNIAKEQKIDYCNIRRGVAKESKTEKLYKIIKKKIYTILLIEVLTDEEIEALKEIKKDIIDKSVNNLNILDSIDINNIFIVYKIFKEFIE